MRRWDDESGAVAVVVAISLLAIIAMTALVVDGGRVQGERGRAQIAADAAALAAAWAACTGGSPTAAGLDAADANGYDDDGITNDVTVANSGTQWTATIATTIDSTFASALETDQMSTAAEAVAACSGGGGGYAIYAASQSCTETIDWSGQNATVTGNVHSQNEIDVSSNNTVLGDVTYVDQLTPGSESNLDFGTPPQGGHRQDPDGEPMPDPPASITVASFLGSPALVTPPGMSAKIDTGWLEANTTYDSTTGVMQDGVYLTSGDIDLGPSDLRGHVTFVSDGGKISLSGSNHDLEPHPGGQGLLAFSTYHEGAPHCTEAGIKMSGSTHSWEGILYAPFSQLEMSGSSNTTFTGSLIAHTVKINGSDLSIQNLPAAGGPVTVSLQH